MTIVPKEWEPRGTGSRRARVTGAASPLVLALVVLAVVGVAVGLFTLAGGYAEGVAGLLFAAGCLARAAELHRR